jgi:hypothetical protein
MIRMAEGRARSGPWMTAGISIVSILMAASLLYSWLVLGFGSNYVCQLPRIRPSQESACFDRYSMWWGLLLGLHLVAIVTAIILWRRPGTKGWGLAAGVLGTGVAAVVFTLAYRVPL